MNWILTPLEVRPDHRNRIGPKAYALSLLAREGFNIPDTLFLTVDGYNAFVNAAGLRERILLELNRKKFKDMRWEEIWDCATRIRHIFLKKQITGPLQSYLTEKIQSHFSEKTLAIRSSAPDEDASGSSFAGLHESFVNVRGTSSILDHIRLVWTSLWSDAPSFTDRKSDWTLKKAQWPLCFRKQWQEIDPVWFSARTPMTRPRL